MAQTTIKIRKVSSYNPATKEKGFSTRAIINGTETIDSLAELGAKNTTLHKAELKMAIEVAMDAVSDALKGGFAVDLGPVGKIYPTVKGKWTKTAEKQSKTDLKKGVYYQASEEVKAAIGSATLSWDSSDKGETVPDKEEEVELPDLEP